MPEYGLAHDLLMVAYEIYDHIKGENTVNIPKGLGTEFEMACNSNATVLITGPTGTGKTSLARLIHERSARKEKPFISINLATVHEGTLESELFGHERGAFTGAETRRVGRLETAQGGTVFLDEVGELSPRLQARLLEFIQSQLIYPVGSNREVRLDVRVIAATHVDLVRAVRSGAFREDLYHRLCVLTIGLRPIAERHDEFDSLVHSCLEQACASSGRTVHRISEEVARLLEAHNWPGNLRELRNVLEYAVLAGKGQEITVADLPQSFIKRQWISRAEKSAVVVEGVASGSDDFSSLGRLMAVVSEVPFSLNYQETIERIEKEYLRRALRFFGGGISRTARGIGINKATLIRRMRAYNLDACSVV